MPEHNEKLVEAILSPAAPLGRASWLSLEGAHAVLDRLTDPALGPDRLVRLGDILGALERAYHPQNPTDEHPRDFIERRFSGGEDG